jgi:hypothetical protein
MTTMTLYAASVQLALPEFLLRDFIKFGFNGRKLCSIQDNRSLFEVTEISEFRNHLEAKWPEGPRPSVPDHVERYLTFEASGLCAFCRLTQPNYELAHITNWAKSRNHSPHNLLRLCLNCHRSHGSDCKLLQGVKEDLIRRLQRMEALYDCDANVSPGDAVYVRDGVARLAIATSKETLASGFIRSTVGANRCSVQRDGVLLGCKDLELGARYVTVREWTRGVLGAVEVEALDESFSGLVV